MRVAHWEFWGLVRIVCGIMALCTCGAGAQSTLYVKASAGNGGDGLSWSSAFSDLQAALAVARSNTSVRQIWISAGDYAPDPTGQNAAATFALVANVALIGGFEGDEEDVIQADPDVHITILTGLASPTAVRANRVVTSTGISGASLTGLTITGGRGGVGNDLRGGGIRISGGSLVINRCIISSNTSGFSTGNVARHGAGIAITSSATVTINDCVIRENTSANGVGATGSSAAVTAGHGGGVSIEGSTVTINRTEFKNNEAGSGGVGVCNLGAPTASSNAGDGGAIWASSATISVNDCVFLENVAGAPAYGLVCTPVRGGTNGLPGRGGAIATISTTSTINRCRFIENTTSNGLDGVCAGGGSGGIVHLSGPGANGGAIFFENSPASVYNSLFVGNIAGRSGGPVTGCSEVDPGATSGSGAAVFSQGTTSSHTITLVCNTLVSNQALGATQGVGLGAGWRGLVSNNIFWGNNGLAASGPMQIGAGTTPILRNNTIQGYQAAQGGTANNATDPLFTDFDGQNNIAGDADDILTLQPSSTLVDSGRNADVPALAQGSDLLGRPRLLNNLAMPDSGVGTAPFVDRGAFENASCIPDCNTNGICDAIEISNGQVVDCNFNGVPDACESVGDPLLTSTFARAGDGLGRAMDMDSDWIAVAAPFDDVFAAPPGDVGSVVMYQYVANAWLQRQRVTASDGTVNDRFGTSVSISGEWMLVAAPTDDHSGLNDAGSVYVFRRSANTWSQTQILRAPDAANDDLFGSSISLDQSFVAIGSPRDDDQGTDSGSVYVFRLNPVTATWTNEQKLTAADGSAGHNFGSAVAVSDGINGRCVLVGATGDDTVGANAGAAYYFNRGGGGSTNPWSQGLKVTPQISGPGQLFGEFVSMDEQSAMISCRGDSNQSVQNAGCLYAYRLKDGHWESEGRLFETDPRGGFGFPCVVSGDFAAAGSPGRTVNGLVGAGRLTIFQRVGAYWVRSDEIDGLPQGGANFGFSIALSGGRLAAGAPNGTTGANVQTGWLRAFSLFSFDCNANGIPDSCEIEADPDLDLDGSGLIDTCEINLCYADYNNDGGVDGSDIESFFYEWEGGSFDADVNNDGGVDGQDVDVFYTAWERGGC